MNRRDFLYFSALSTASLVFAGCGIDPQGRGYSVNLPMWMISKKFAEQFPIKQELTYGGFKYGTIEIVDPKLLGAKGKDKMSLGVGFKFYNMFLPDGISGSVALNSGVRYDSTTTNIFLVKPEVEDVTVQNVSLGQFLTGEVRKAIGIVVAETIEKRPIYNLKENKSMVSGFIKGIDIRDGELVLTFGL